ncbi:MAG TPA: hypothetical protein QGG70_03110 [Candidatus Pacearchaeota archaeon]|nr:hypothetical protein [Candidatus Pacearchaeota archaeon]
MVNKKAQAQIITTILIILLVLAAIIIIWQVVGGTVREGAEEIESQSSCLGLRIDITNVFKGDDKDGAIITIRPTKNISGWEAYVNGVTFGKDPITPGVKALDTIPIEADTDDPIIESGDEIEIIAKMGDAICPGVKQKVK